MAISEGTKRSRREQGLCICGHPTRNGKAKCTNCAEKRKKWYQDHRELTIQRSWKSWLTQKDTVINHYGGVCACCGEDYPGFLVLDHINGGGTQHRLEINKTTGSRNLYAWVIREKFPLLFQVLCANCNMAKGSKNHKCIHQLQREQENNS